MCHWRMTTFSKLNAHPYPCQLANTCYISANSRVSNMQLQSIVTTPATVGSAISDEEAGALARTTVNLFKAWNLTDLEACILLGGMSARTWARWKTGARWKEGGIGRI